jgi:hypothetical protein
VIGSRRRRGFLGGGPARHAVRHEPGVDATLLGEQSDLALQLREALASLTERLLRGEQPAGADAFSSEQSRPNVMVCSEQVECARAEVSEVQQVVSSAQIDESACPVG